MKLFRSGCLAILALALAACGRTPSDPDAAFAAYIKAYSGGMVAENAPVRVELARPVSLDAQKTGLFSFSPAIKGETRWLSPSEAVFVPDEGALHPGTSYEGAFRLGDVADVQRKDLKTFKFRFKVPERTVELVIDGMKISEGADDAVVTGSVKFSGEVSKDALKKGLSCTYPGGSPALTVADDGVRFQVSGLQRSSSDRTLNISVQVPGFDKAESSVMIPARGRFKVVDARIEEGSNPHVAVIFSEPLAPAASRAGLIEISGAVRQYVDVKDNTALVYFENRSDGPMTLRVNRGVSSVAGESLYADFSAEFAADEPKPAVEIPLQGNILPDKASLILPLRAVNLSAVDIKVIKIYENNILTFLQDNDLGGGSDLRRSGRLVYSRQLRLDSDPSIDLHKWNDFSVDIGGLFRREPGAIYRIRVTFNKDYSLYGKKAVSGLIPLSDGAPSEEEEAVWDEQESYYWDSYMDWDEYEWDEREDPSKPSYYMVSERFPVVNLLSSDLGIIGKYADGKTLWLSVSDIKTAKPRSGVKLEVYDFQLQRIGSGSTDGKGMAEIQISRKPFAVIARSGSTCGYLRMADGFEKSLSRFDVGGQKLERGLKGFIYGERGVWRPGDTLHVTLLLGDRGHLLPEGHPATLELYTPEGQFYTREVAPGVDGFHAFTIATSVADPTGMWNAYVKVGGTAFHKGLSIETVKPNRLKVNLDLGNGALRGGTQMSAMVSSSWLTGPPAAGLKAKAEMTLTPGSSSLPGFEGYIFRNPASNFTSSEHSLFETKLDENGRGAVQISLPKASGAPGMLNAFIVTSVEENGGDESFTTMSVPYSPFDAYVGLKFPEGGSYLETDKDQTIRVALVGPDGKRVSGRRIEYKVFKLKWSWWWESRSSELDSYVNGRSAQPIVSGVLTSGSQDGTFNIRVDYPDWGRYLVIARDMTGGHVSGKVITIDWPSYRGRADRRDPDALTMLSFAIDKDSYMVGDKATVYVPSAKDGRALVSLENGSKVISREWVQTDAEKDTPYSFTVSEDMAPNFYVHITLLQPYGNATNDLPIRLYGVQRASVENPASHLEPEIKMADTVAPEEPFTVKVSEKKGRTMTYTLAIVDEGLLDLTAFKTPAPWDAMYRTEALGVRTWDLYDQVIGAYSGRFSPMLSIGGDQENIRAARKDNRFNPVVKFIGPFTVKKGSMSHEIRLPMYVGSVRVMVVAGHDGAYGSTDKTVTVKAPLMLLTSLPRVISAGEDVVLPVNVFAMEDGINKATVSVKVEGNAAVEGNASQDVTFEKAGDKMVRFALKAGEEGTARITVTANGSGHKAYETVFLEVRNPNPETVSVVSKVIKNGASASFNAGKGSTLELAGFPAVDATAMLNTMKNYPYNCTEQLSARGLVALHLMKMLPEDKQAEASEMVKSTIKELYSRQNSDGGFILWPSSRNSGTWISSMAGMFLSEASSAGFQVQRSVLNSWLKYQKNLSQAFRLAGASAFSEIDESYRLYTLAVSGNAQPGAMNRLKESGLTDGRARMMLADAYAVSGKQQTAKELTMITPAEGETPVQVMYGSSTRDNSVALEVSALCGDMASAIALAQEVASDINSGWYSTQEAAFAAVAMDRLWARMGDGNILADVSGTRVASARNVYSMPVEGKIDVKNNGEGLIYATVVNVSRPEPGTPVSAKSSGIEISASYAAGGKAIRPESVAQGTEFTATVTVKNPTVNDYSSLALSEVIPSGWEIINERLRTGGAVTYDHQDIRDDRCNWFFDLAAGKSRTFQLKLRAAYEGAYVLPAITVNAMYDPHVAANTASGTTRVTR